MRILKILIGLVISPILLLLGVVWLVSMALNTISPREVKE